MGPDATALQKSSKTMSIGAGKTMIESSALSESAGIVAELPWNGHWEVWEMEWGGARWIWDYAKLEGVSSRAS
jgi:hypothetical protein